MKTLLNVLYFCGALVALPSMCLGLDAKAPKGGAYVGVDLGWMASFKTTSSNDGTTTTNTTADTFPYGAVGLKLGYSHYFSSRLGVRGYVDYGYGFTTLTNNDGTATTKTSTGVHQLALNVDALVNILAYKNVIFGAYAGLGFGYAASSDDTYTTGTTTTTDGPSGMYIPINLGISANIEENHRVDVGVKIQTFKTSTNVANTESTTTTDTTKLRSLIFGVTYSYFF